MIPTKEIYCSKLIEHICHCNEFTCLSKTDYSSLGNYSTIECSCGFRLYVMGPISYNYLRIGEGSKTLERSDKPLVYEEDIDTLFFYILKNGDIKKENQEMIDKLLILPYMKIRDEEKRKIELGCGTIRQETTNPKLKDAIKCMEVKDADEE